MNTCQAPYRLPEGFYERLESDIDTNSLTPEEAAVDLTMILATDHECGEPALATVNYKGRTMHVCAWHEELRRTVIAPFSIEN